LSERQLATSFLAIADLRLAAWFLWITPLLTALSSLREASRSSSFASSASPAALAVLNLRIAVFNDDLTALLRTRRFSSCPFLVWVSRLTRRARLPGRAAPGQNGSAVGGRGRCARGRDRAALGVLLPGGVPVGPAVGPGQALLGALDHDRIADVREVPQPVGVLRRDVGAAVRHVALALVAY